MRYAFLYSSGSVYKTFGSPEFEKCPRSSPYFRRLRVILSGKPWGGIWHYAGAEGFFYMYDGSGVLYSGLLNVLHSVGAALCISAFDIAFIDRCLHGYVIDFFYFKWIDFPVFNVADIYVTVAAALLLISFTFYYKEEDIDLIYRQLLFWKKKEKH